jgi:type IV pilus assembly protein PilW
MSAATAAPAARGFSLIQLLVGIGVGTSVIAALGTFFIQGSRSSREDINVASMLNELGFAAGSLTTDLEMAGFWAQVHDPSAIQADGTLALTGADCGVAGWYQDLRALEVMDNGTAAEIHAQFPCIEEADVVPGTDVIAIKRVLGRVTPVAELQNGLIYLRTYQRWGLLFRQGGGTPMAMGAPSEDWQYAPSVYYVQRYTNAPSESPLVPALCRRTLRSGAGGTPEFARDCVAQGVENLQVEVGVDTDEDGAANHFTQDPGPTDLARAATARVYLLVRSVRSDIDYANKKTYQISNGDSFTPSGADVHYFRKTLTTEVALRNLRGLQGVAIQ